MTKPALLLLPNLIGDSKNHELFLPASVDKAVSSLDGLIAESTSGGLRYLSRFKTKKPANAIPIALCNKNTLDQDLDFLLDPILEGERWGLVSDAGLPCIADPGSKLVFRARQRGILVQAFVGPSSILMALMLSGLSGQSFAFHGYLSKDQEKQKHQIQQLEKRSQMEQSTQIFMETPHRNSKTLQLILDTLHDQTLLCVAWDLTLPSQGVVTQPIYAWKTSTQPNLDKRNALFLFMQPQAERKGT
jgi:16S rRNA (cytidine1402-2'-O)-methyltransferase